MKYIVQSPIALFIYKRPDVLKKTMQSISKVKPKKIYIIADGPKDKNESNYCKKAQQVVENSINWKCEVVKIYATKNLGLRKRVVSGLGEVFKKEDQAIILEDDCVANQSFFKFCDQMLDKYEKNTNIFSITGNNFQFGRNSIPGSYYFSKHFHSWGWATWKRAWSHYDDSLSDLDNQIESGLFKKIFKQKSVGDYWKYILKKVKNNEIDSWAYRWSYAHFKNLALSVTPEKNLVSNIGYGKDATHTLLKDKRMGMRVNQLKFPLSHSKEIIAFTKADEYIDKTVHASFRNRLAITIKNILNI